MGKLSHEQLQTLTPKQTSPKCVPFRKRVRDEVKRIFEKIPWVRIRQELSARTADSGMRVILSKDEWEYAEGNILRAGSRHYMTIAYWLYTLDDDDPNVVKECRSVVEDIFRETWDGRTAEEEYERVQEKKRQELEEKRKKLEKKAASRQGRLAHSDPLQEAPPKHSSEHKCVSPQSSLHAHHESLLKRIEIVTTPNDDNWLNPYNHRSIPLFGREDEQKRLDAFLTNSAFIQICAVCGSSGVGKTRLVAEWLQPYRAEGLWDAGYLTNYNAEHWQTWVPTKDTLIIVENFASLKQIVALVFQRCLHLDQNGATNTKIRFLFVERIFPSTPRELAEHWSAVFGRREEIETRENLLVPAIQLDLADERQEIAKNIACHVGNLSNDDPDAGRRVANALLEEGEHGTLPLIAALVGYRLSKGEGDHTGTVHNLIEYYLSGSERAVWEDPSPPKIIVGCFVGAATICGGIEFHRLLSLIANQYDTIVNRRHIVRECNRIVGSSDTTVLKPMGQHIVGQMFVALLLSELRYRPEWLRFLANCIFCKKDQEGIRSTSLKLYDFVMKVRRSLPKSPASSSDILFDALVHFIHPKLYPDVQEVRMTLFACYESLKRSTNYFGDRNKDLIGFDEIYKKMDEIGGLLGDEEVLLDLTRDEPGTMAHAIGEIFWNNTYGRPGAMEESQRRLEAYMDDLDRRFPTAIRAKKQREKGE